MGFGVEGTAWQSVDPSRIEDDTSLAGLARYWRCANYLAAAEIYLRSNVLLRAPLEPADLKARIVGHWGTAPGLTFLFSHLNLLIAATGQSTLVVTGPGHGGNAGAATAFLDGTLRERDPRFSNDEKGVQELCRSYSAPGAGGIAANFAPEIPGSIHKGGELGYALVHAFGAALDNPDLLSVAIIGDGEMETAPTCAAWQLVRLMNPLTDGAVLPIVHLNGYKISTPALIARVSEEDRVALFRSLGYEPLLFRAGFDDEGELSIHRRFAGVLAEAYNMICAARARAAAGGEPGRLPVVLFSTPKGWTCPAWAAGKPLAGSWRTHDAPFANARENEGSFEQLASWLASYRPQELFDENGAVLPEVVDWLPRGELRLGANPVAHGGVDPRPLNVPVPDAHAFDPDRGSGCVPCASAAQAVGAFLTDVVAANPARFRLFSPDEMLSNRLQDVFGATERQWNAAANADPDNDEHLGSQGAVVELLSEHLMEGLLEGYTLTGRHGVFATYEAFAQVVSSMVGQHCKWLNASAVSAPWRGSVPALNLLLTSHVWRQEHNGFTHQDPGFADVLLDKRYGEKGVVANLFYPADANMALAVAERMLGSSGTVNALVAGKQPAPVFQTLAEARDELEAGAAEWSWASTAHDERDLDVVLAACGDVPTFELLCAARLLARYGVSLRFVNVVDPFSLGVPDPAFEEGGSMPASTFAEIFGARTPVLFAFHGYPGTVKRLLFDRPDPARFMVCGYRERGATTSPFELLRMSGMDRWSLAERACALVASHEAANPARRGQLSQLAAYCREKRAAARAYAVEHGADDPSFAAGEC